MRRLDPPPLATWILERCTPGQRDQALAGDLLEEFQCGRSHGWYWRQCLAACLVGWVRYLGNRTSLIAFATLWSMLAPAWSTLVDRVHNHFVAWPVDIAAWLALNLVFIWTGHAALRHPAPAIHRALRRKKAAQSPGRSSRRLPAHVRCHLCPRQPVCLAGSRRAALSRRIAAGRNRRSWHLGRCPPYPLLHHRSLVPVERRASHGRRARRHRRMELGPLNRPR